MERKLNAEATAAAADQCGVVFMNECADKWALTSLARGKVMTRDFREKGHTYPSKNRS